MLFKVQNFYINSRLPLVQGSITSTIYFAINSTGNSSKKVFSCNQTGKAKSKNILDVRN